MHERSVGAGVDLGGQVAQRGVETMVEADLDPPPRLLGGLRAATRLGLVPSAAGFSTRTWLPASSARCASGDELIVRGRHHDHVRTRGSAARRSRRMLARRARPTS